MHSAPAPLPSVILINFLSFYVFSKDPHLTAPVECVNDRTFRVVFDFKIYDDCI